MWKISRCDAKCDFICSEHTRFLNVTCIEGIMYGRSDDKSKTYMILYSIKVSMS